MIDSSVKRICFIHVPKAAGTSILSVMSAHFGSDTVFHVAESRFWTMPIAYLLRRHPIIAGHFSVQYLSNEVLEDTFVFSFLRNPLQRILSQYGYFRNVGHPSNDPEVSCAVTQELPDIIKARINQDRFSPWTNWQTKIFSGCGPHQPATAETLARAKHNLEQLAFVGLQEEAREGVSALLRMWGRSDALELPNLNRTADRPLSHAIGIRTRDLIEEANTLDRELYLHAKDLWRKRHKPPGKPQIKTDLAGKAEYGSREIEIESLSIESDSEGCCELWPNRPWRLCLTLYSSIAENRLTVGIKISDAIGLTLYGTNSYLQGRTFNVGPGESVIKIDFPENILAPGRYSITAALHAGFASEEKCYHWLENALEFKVIAPPEKIYIGAIDLGAQFRDIDCKSLGMGLLMCWGVACLLSVIWGYGLATFSG